MMMPVDKNWREREKRIREEETRERWATEPTTKHCRTAMMKWLGINQPTNSLTSPLVACATEGTSLLSVKTNRQSIQVASTNRFSASIFLSRSFLVHLSVFPVYFLLLPSASFSRCYPFIWSHIHIWPLLLDYLRSRLLHLMPSHHLFASLTLVNCKSCKVLQQLLQLHDGVTGAVIFTKYTNLVFPSVYSFHWHQHFPLNDQRCFNSSVKNAFTSHMMIFILKCGGAFITVSTSFLPSLCFVSRPPGC